MGLRADMGHSGSVMPATLSLLGGPAGPPPCGIHAGCASAQLGAPGFRFTRCACLSEFNGAGRADAQDGRFDTWAPRTWVFMLSLSFGGGVGEAAVPEEVLPASSSLTPTFSFSCVLSLPFCTPGRSREGHSGSGVQQAGIQKLFVLKSQPQLARCWGKGEHGRAGQAALGCQSGLQPAYCLALQAPSFSTLRLHPLAEVNR